MYHFSRSGTYRVLDSTHQMIYSIAQWTLKSAGTLFERKKKTPNRPQLLGRVKLTSAFPFQVILFMQASKYY